MNSRTVARIAVLTAAAGLLAACGTSGSSRAAGNAASAAGQPATTASSAAASSSAPAGAAAAGFVPIVEPFSPGHPAQTGPAPASCTGQATTLAIESCYTAKTENLDAAIDTVQLAHYNSATASGKAAILAQDSAWLAARQPVCAAAFHSGGTIDGINIASCLLDESTARLDTVKGITPPLATRKGTDSPDPAALSWYTTPEGSRIAEMNSQGDSTGGAIVAWTIIGGADGFVVNPKQFYYQDSAFIGMGLVQQPDPTGHRVATGQEYQFGLDYSHLSADPNANKSAAGYFYVPGSPAAVWK